MLIEGKLANRMSQLKISIAKASIVIKEMQASNSNCHTPGSIKPAYWSIDLIRYGIDNHAIVKASAKITIAEIALSVEGLTASFGSHNFIVFMIFSFKKRPSHKSLGTHDD